MRPHLFCVHMRACMPGWHKVFKYCTKGSAHFQSILTYFLSVKVQLQQNIDQHEKLTEKKKRKAPAHKLRLRILHCKLPSSADSCHFFFGCTLYTSHTHTVLTSNNTRCVLAHETTSEREALRGKHNALRCAGSVQHGGLSLHGEIEYMSSSFQHAHIWQQPQALQVSPISASIAELAASDCFTITIIFSVSTSVESMDSFIQCLYNTVKP